MRRRCDTAYNAELVEREDGRAAERDVDALVWNRRLGLEENGAEDGRKSDAITVDVNFDRRL
jgi:hypothetical protein